MRGLLDTYTGPSKETGGQIKIDLSVESYEIQDVTTKHKRTQYKTPSLKSIMKSLKITRAVITRIRAEGRFTVIDYTT
jgi:hypothetical protein